MSISLDFALFMRNSATKLGLSLANEAVAFKLAFRIGSNSMSWVSQESLMQESGIEKLDNLTNHLKKLSAAGIVVQGKSNKDKRKNTYSFSRLLVNYHQKSDLEKNKIHLALKDTMLIAVDNSENTPRNQGVFSKITPRKRGVKNRVTPRKRGVMSSENSLESPVAVGLEENENSAKGTLKQRNIYKQRNRANAGSVFLTSFPDDFLPDERSNEMLAIHATRTNCSFRELLGKFRKVHTEYSTKSKDWQKTFQDFLITERPKKTYEDQNGRKRRYDNQPINY